MNWANVGAPQQVIDDQKSWELTNRIRRAYEAGASVREICQKLNRCSQTIYQHIQKSKRRDGRTCPIEQWLTVGRIQEMRYITSHLLEKQRKRDNA